MARLAFPDIPGVDRLAALVIRAVVGPVMAYHGYLKLDRPGGAGAFADVVARIHVLGIGLPRMIGYVVVAIELIGGICIAIGLLTRIWSALLAGQMLLIPLVVKRSVGLIAPPDSAGVGFEIDLLIAACALALVLMGPGALALDSVLGVEGARGRTAAADRRQPAPGH
jgi:putative oxidoreductase